LQSSKRGYGGGGGDEAHCCRRKTLRGMRW
jgi:hypothetical protein